MPEYIDAGRFTRLFSEQDSQKTIETEIYQIAQRFVMRYAASHPREMLEDAASEAAVLGIRKISHYRNRCDPKNAFSYFTKLIQRKVWEYIRIEQRRSRGLAPWGGRHSTADSGTRGAFRQAWLETGK